MIREATDADFNEILKENPNVVVKYYADWCGSCRLFAPKYRRIADELGGGEITFLDVNAETNPEARKLGKVTNLPYFAVFKNGEMVQGEATSKEEYLREMIGNLN